MTDVIDRAKKSLGTSSDAVYALTARLIGECHRGRGTLLDVGCGAGRLWPFVQTQFETYIGADVLRYDGFPASADFHTINLDTGNVPLADGSADVVAGLETIEHLENPRAYVRELVRLCKPGGWVVVTTPNQLSLLSKLSLVLLNEFSWFRGGNYPAHITALVEIDLRRIAAECKLENAKVDYSRHGRIPGVSVKWPGFLSGLIPQALSDNVGIIAQKPA